MSVEWSETAVSHLRTIRDSRHWKSAGYGQAIVDRIFHRAKQLDSNAYHGSEVTEYGDPNIREVFEYPYVIIYRVIDERVLIVTVLHSSRQIPETFPKT